MELARPTPSLTSIVCANSLSAETRQLADKYGLSVSQVSWEDCARNKNSCWGPNITDMCLCVDGANMPVIRAPNMSDVTFDVPLDEVVLVVGNELVDGMQSTVTLRQYLEGFRHYLHNPEDWLDEEVSLLAPERDSHVLTSAQACFLPVDASGNATFNTSVYNYQTRRDDPSVLVIVSSAAGTSAQVITNRNQLVNFNKAGRAMPFAAQRLSEDRRQRGVAIDGEMTVEEKQQNCLLVIQVPLKQKPAERMRSAFGSCIPQGGCIPEGGFMPKGAVYTTSSSSSSSGFFSSLSAPMSNSVGVPQCVGKAKKHWSLSSGKKVRSRSRREDDFDSPSSTDNVEHAIVRVSDDDKGPFEEIGKRKIARDPRFPIRMTIQFYKCTDNGVISDASMQAISEQLQKARSKGDFVGSLVTNPAGDRPTEPRLSPSYTTPAWWNLFWDTHGPSVTAFTKETAAMKAFSGSRLAGLTMSEAEPHVLRILTGKSMTSAGYGHMVM